jgi:hypothetical protein
MESKYNPRFKIGTKVYALCYSGEIIELEIVKIEIIETKENIKYLYHTPAYPPFENLENDGPYFLTREEAEKALDEYKKKEKELRKQKIIKEYERIKKEYEEIMNES